MREGKILYDSFNARYLSAEEVAETFIPNDQFDALLTNNHSLLMGPRGSGKTTILKMLSPLSLHFWKGKKADSVKQNLPFIGVYIPTDVQWKRQLDQLEKELKQFPKYNDLISRLSVTTNVLLALCKTFSAVIELKEHKNDNDLDNEVILSKALIDIWKLKKPISPNLLSIEQSLYSRLTEINSHTKQTKYSAKSEEDIHCPDYFFDDYFDLTNEACAAFENIFKGDLSFIGKSFRWALCFDELEIAPYWLQMELVEYLRSRDQRILFKLTTSPLISLINNINKQVYKVGARQDDDYKIIRTWANSSRDFKRWGSFCNKLIESKIKRRLGIDITPNNLFGNDKLDRSISEALNIKEKDASYSSSFDYGSPMWHLTRIIANYDHSFKIFLQKKGIDAKNPVPSTEAQKDTVFRKMKPILIYKYQFRSNIGKRSRKVFPLHYGIPYIFDICDGNPRSLIGLVDELLSKIERDTYGRPIQMPINAQSRVILDVSERYLKLISTHPEANKVVKEKILNLGDILKTIGLFFHDRIVNDPFRLDPASTFTIDEGINHKILELLELALQLGAIIYINPNEGLAEKGLINKKFRLSYLLTPIFKLPKREYSSVNLSTILFSTTYNNKSISYNQPSLFD